MGGLAVASVAEVDERAAGSISANENLGGRGLAAAAAAAAAAAPDADARLWAGYFRAK